MVPARIIHTSSSGSAQKEQSIKCIVAKIEASVGCSGRARSHLSCLLAAVADTGVPGYVCTFQAGARYSGWGSSLMCAL